MADKKKGKFMSREKLSKRIFFFLCFILIGFFNCILIANFIVILNWGVNSQTKRVGDKRGRKKKNGGRRREKGRGRVSGFLREYDEGGGVKRPYTVK